MAAATIAMTVREVVIISDSIIMIFILLIVLLRISFASLWLVVQNGPEKNE